MHNVALSSISKTNVNSKDKIKMSMYIRQSHTLCLSLRSTNGRRTWWRRFMISRFSSSESKAYRNKQEQG